MEENDRMGCVVMHWYDKAASQRAHMPEGTEHIVQARRLATDHKRLSELLKPGMLVLDVGCSTGAITADMADAVMPGGHVVGCDINERLIQQAKQHYNHIPGLEFCVSNVYDLHFENEFNIVTAARVLQWLSNVEKALYNMRRSAVIGGKVVVLDYNHLKLKWHPKPPSSVLAFYKAFLSWREDAGMNNALADDLVTLFDKVDLQHIRMSPQHEHTSRSNPQFKQHLSIWSTVIRTRGKQMITHNYITEEQREQAEKEYNEWVEQYALSQTMYLLAVEGRKIGT